MGLNKALAEHDSSNWAPPPTWTRNENYEPIDGEYYIIAIPVRNEPKNKYYWQVDQVQVVIYEDGISLHQGDEPYSDWEWDDVEYFMKCET